MLPIHVISLKASTSRRDLCAGMLGAAGLPFSFFDAVNGNDLDENTWARHYDAAANQEQFKRGLSASEVGCYLSHLHVWAKIATDGPGAALVLEDDAQIDAGLGAFLTQIAEFDLNEVYVKLDGVSEEVDLEDKTITKMNLGRRKVIHTAPIAPRTTGYIIGAGAARKMCAARARFFRPVDIDIKHYWEHGVPVWTVAPQLVSEMRSRGDESTIEASRQENKGSNPLWRFWKNTTYQYNYLRLRKQHPPVSRTLLSEKS